MNNLSEWHTGNSPHSFIKKITLKTKRIPWTKSKKSGVTRKQCLPVDSKQTPSSISTHFVWSFLIWDRSEWSNQPAAASYLHSPGAKWWISSSLVHLEVFTALWLRFHSAFIWILNVWSGSSTHDPPCGKTSVNTLSAPSSWLPVLLQTLLPPRRDPGHRRPSWFLKRKTNKTRQNKLINRLKLL